ncbi:putative amidase [Camellia lanceoleosa]|uniref:Amidase n=1 Tax=Camellia lanceoleosa TaxID=1840588 RepID=A0ACC0IJQ6_9ERIC|nr:putative amidase [Camellia lanceoleosa]
MLDMAANLQRRCRIFVYVLDANVGFDPYDAVATRKASKYIPHGGYVQFLKADGLRGKRLGITSYPSFGFPNDSENSHAFELHFNTLRNGFGEHPLLYLQDMYK